MPGYFMYYNVSGYQCLQNMLFNSGQRTHTSTSKTCTVNKKIVINGQITTVRLYIKLQKY